jgi:hypothetical protein
MEQEVDRRQTPSIENEDNGRVVAVDLLIVRRKCDCLCGEVIMAFFHPRSCSTYRLPYRPAESRPSYQFLGPTNEKTSNSVFREAAQGCRVGSEWRGDG